MPHHPSPSPKEILELGHWLWPGAVRIDAEGKVWLQKASDSNPRPFLPQEHLEHALGAWKAMAQQGLHLKALAEVEVRIAEHRFVNKGKFRWTETPEKECLGKARCVSTLRTSDGDTLPRGLINEHLRKIIRGIRLDPSTQSVAHWFVRFDRMGFAARALGSWTDTQGRSRLGLAPVHPDKLRIWFRSFLREVLRMEAPICETILLSQLYDLDDAYIESALDIQEPSMGRIRRHGCARLKQELAFRYGLQWTGHHVDFLVEMEASEMDRSPWNVWQLAPTPTRAARRWILSHAGGPHLAGLVTHYLSQIMGNKQGFMIAHGLLGTDACRLAEAEGLAPAEVVQEIKAGVRELDRLLEEEHQKRPVLAASTWAMLTVIRQARRHQMDANKERESGA